MMTVGRKTALVWCAWALGILAAQPAIAALPIGTAFTYQGTLADAGGAVTNTSPGCNFEFTLWDDPVAGMQIGGTESPSGVPVEDGVFTVELDFGSGAFDGQARYLDISVCCPSPGCTLDPLDPRVELTPAPHAFALPGLYTSPSGDGAYIDSTNIVGGHPENSVGAGVGGATIAGGGRSGSPNTVTGSAGTIGGGRSNTAGAESTVGGGISNTASGSLSTVGGGTTNMATDIVSTVSGGTSNTANGFRSTVGGGSTNMASGLSSTVPGGEMNRAGGDYSFAAGRRAKADHAGTHVWADSTDADFTSTGPDQYLIRAAGGVGINTDSPTASLEIGGTAGVDGIRFPDGTLQTTAGGGGGGGDGHSLDAADGDPVDAVYVDNDGEVGIGTFSPQRALDVRGPAGSTFAGQLMLRSGDSSGAANTGGGIVFGGSDGISTPLRWGVIRGMKENSTVGDQNSYMTFLTTQAGGLSEKMRITSTGNVGIGATVPTSRLQVHADSSSDNAIHAIHLGSSGDAAGVLGQTQSNTGRGVVGLAVAASGISYGVYGQNSSTAGRGVCGIAAATSGTTYGVYGRTDSTSGRGLYGEANPSSGTTYGVYGLSHSTSGRGVYGLADSSGGTSVGVFGESESSSGTGVFGLASATSGFTNGVVGQSDSPDGRGVVGLVTDTTGPAIGVYGETDSPAGTGVHGKADASTGDTSGVYGESDSTSGTGVFGLADAGSGTTYGVRGQSTSTSGKGVYGLANASSGTTEGVRGQVISTSGRGVYGYASAISGGTYGVYGISNSPSGTGVYGFTPVTTGFTVGVSGQSDSPTGTGVSGFTSAFSGASYAVRGQCNSTSGFDFYADGNGMDYGSSSSIRWKRNVRAIDDPLGKVGRLRGVYYDWDVEHGGKHDVGMIAEEVGRVLPEIVTYEENGVDANGMDYSKLTPLLVEAVKELNAEIERLKAERRSSSPSGAVRAGLPLLAIVLLGLAALRRRTGKDGA